MPQTHEHLAIVDLLGIDAGVVTLTKADLAEPEVADLAEEEVRVLIAGTSLAGAELVRVSAQTGAGIPELRAALVETEPVSPERFAEAVIARFEAYQFDWGAVRRDPRAQSTQQLGDLVGHVIEELRSLTSGYLSGTLAGATVIWLPPTPDLKAARGAARKVFPDHLKSAIGDAVHLLIQAHYYAAHRELGHVMMFEDFVIMGEKATRIVNAARWIEWAALLRASLFARMPARRKFDSSTGPASGRTPSTTASA